MQGCGKLIGPGLIPRRDDDRAILQDREALHLIGLEMGQPGVLPTAFDEGCGPTPDLPVVGDREIEAIQQLIAEFVEGRIIGRDALLDQASRELLFAEALQEGAEAFLDRRDVGVEEAGVDEFDAGRMARVLCPGKWDGTGGAAKTKGKFSGDAATCSGPDERGQIWVAHMS